MTTHYYTATNARPYQEDRAVIKLNLHEKQDVTATETEHFDRHKIDLLFVADGHGGHNISESVAKMLPPYFYKAMILEDNVPKPTAKYNEYIISTFDKVQNELNAKHNKSTEQGTTVCMVLIYEYKGKKFISSVSAGDSRAASCDQLLFARALTLDHKPDAPREYHRIMAAGGKVERGGADVARVNGVLAVSRSMGDFDNKVGVIHTPDIQHILGDQKFIVIATDGLWDVMNNQQVIDFVLYALFDMVKNNTFQIRSRTKKEKDNIAYRLAEEAIRLGSEDNITIIIYFIDKEITDYARYI
jgi:serine/threonine protein phosphatase PrpC